jgi:hypothetical protein
MPAANLRFGATAAGSADLKGSAKIPPLRQAAIPLAVTRDDVVVERDGLTERQYGKTLAKPQERGINFLIIN